MDRSQIETNLQPKEELREGREPQPKSALRLNTISINVGNITVGGSAPIVVQSMTTSDTMDTDKVVEEIKTLKDGGCEIVRLTVPNLRAAENLEKIKNILVKKNYSLPLVADIHFTPKAAIRAAELVEKVRINPGNFADRKHFKVVGLNDKEYERELFKIADKFIPLLEVCKKNQTALRIGSNHGSLSDRIVTRYGDTPLGMVESALEYLNLAEENNFYNIVFSMKSSNPIVMVNAYRLLVQKLIKRGRGIYPLHLGVTEAGDGDDGRVKSALGIGSLLNEGIGDTIRVSLTEDSRYEIPVAKKIIAAFSALPSLQQENREVKTFNPNHLAANFIKTKQIEDLGGNQTPKVILKVGERDSPLALSKKGNSPQPFLEEIGFHYNPTLDKWESSEAVPDYLLRPVSRLGEINDKEVNKIPPQLKLISYQKLNYFNPNSFNNNLKENRKDRSRIYFSSWKDYLEFVSKKTYSEEWDVVWVKIQSTEIGELEKLKTTRPSWEGLFHPKTIFVVENLSNRPALGLAHLIIRLKDLDLNFPIVPVLNKGLLKKWSQVSGDLFQPSKKEASLILITSYFGPLLINNLIDGLMMEGEPDDNLNELIQTAFKVLQAARKRIFKTEYISCPSCGRTLFDLQEVTAKIKARTEHLKGVKIAIMGCIVNGPGEMADADFGYVGSGPGKITLYKGKEPVLRGVPSSRAVDELINLLKKEGYWKQKNTTH